MNIVTSHDKIHDLIRKYPFLVKFLASYNPKFEILKNPVARNTMGRMATVRMAAAMAGISLQDLLDAVAGEIRSRTGKDVQTEDADNARQENVKKLKNVIRQLHAGGSFEDAKRQFDEVVGQAAPGEVAAMEEQLIRDGLPASEVQRLCDLHTGVFKTALDARETVQAPAGHPVHTYMAENQKLSALADELARLAGKSLGDAKDVLERLGALESHYVRKENQLFPMLERSGITGPTQVMWGVHDQIRDLLKTARQAVRENDRGAFSGTAPALARAVSEMVYKENRILFPMAMETLSDEQWLDVRRGEDELGYALAEPGGEWPGRDAITPKKENSMDGTLKLGTGELTLEQVDALLRHLPVDISFVDAENRVRYYSDTADRLFPRSPAVIGRSVDKCHPPKSVDKVLQITEAFRKGEKDVAEFWIELGGRFIHIRYFAVRNAEKEFLGTLEVSQDLTEIRKLKGVRRLVDW
jgi:DUF438 domain-containing protein